MKGLKQYLCEKSSDLLDEMLSEKNWIRQSSSEDWFYIYFNSKPEFLDMIPYNEFNLKKPEELIITLKKESSDKYIGIIKWSYPKHIDKNIYICNGWTVDASDKKDLTEKLYNIMVHLSKSKKARDKFKQLILSYKEHIDKRNSEQPENYTDPKDMLMSYNKKISTYNLDQLLKF